jgi:hypothetical protein
MTALHLILANNRIPEFLLWLFLIGHERSQGWPSHLSYLAPFTFLLEIYEGGGLSRDCRQEVTLMWIMDGTVCIQNTTESIQEATSLVIKCAGLYIDGAGSHFKQQLAKITKLLCSW